MRVYRSSDASAPALRGNTPGDLINLLDKCLVTGYGSKAAAGWTKPYTGTNLAVFRNGAGSNGMYLRVDDTSTAATNRAARVRGFEAMSDVNTGTPQPFPTEVQQSGGGYWWTKYTSSTAANAREWIVWADEKRFYIYIDNYPEQTTQEYNNSFYGFGDILSYKTGDATHTFLLHDPSTSAPYTSQQYFNQPSSLSGAHGSLHMARRFDQLGSPVAMGWHSDYVKQTATMGSGGVSYPHGPDGALLMAPVFCHDPTSSPYNIRGVFPGLWAHCHASSIFGHLDTFSGQGDLAGREFIVIRGGSSSSIIVETSDTWE
jgi:hypothetical protein